MVGTDHPSVAVGDEERFRVRCPCRFSVHQGTYLCPIDVTPYSNQNRVSLFTGRILWRFHNDCLLTIGRRDRNVARCPDRRSGPGVHRIIIRFRLRPSGNRNDRKKKQDFGIHTGSVAQNDMRRGGSDFVPEWSPIRNESVNRTAVALYSPSTARCAAKISLRPTSARSSNSFNWLRE